MSDAGGCGRSDFARQQDAFGCTVTNRFDWLLDDDGDPFDILHQAEVERQRRKQKEEVKRSDTGKAGKKESQKDRRTGATGSRGLVAHMAGAGQKLSNSGKIQNENRGVAGVERGGRRPVFRERRLNEMEPSQQSVMYRPGPKLEMGDYVRGMDGMGCQRSTDGFNQRGKREFDRQSSSYKSSVRPYEKREGNGPRNWGSVKDTVSYESDAAPSEQGRPTEEAEEVLQSNGENRSADGEGDRTTEVTVEMTLDEWKAFQEQNRPKAEFNLRKADSSMPSKAVIIHESKYLEDIKEELNENSHFVQRPANDITHSMDINFGSLARPSRGGRGGRGGRGRGGSVSRTEIAQPEAILDLAPNPDDMEDFPALA